MAGTDDVAREVADILFDQTVKAGAMAAGVTPKVLQGLGNVTQVTMSQVIDEIKKNHNLRKMMGLKGEEVSMQEMTELLRRFGEKSSSVLIGNTDAADYAKLLKGQGVTYAMMDKKDDNCVMFVFFTKDLEKVENASHILQAQRGKVTELNAKLYFNELSPDQVHVVEGLTPVEMELYRHYAREQGLLFSSIPRRDGDLIICDVKDEQKARKALLYTGWALTGANGARVREQVERRLAGRTAINIAAEEGERELYVMSQTRPGQYVHITAEDYKFYKDNKQVSSVSRKDPDFYAKCVASCEALAHPVPMSAEQFQAGITAQDLERAHTIDLFPNSHDDMEEMDRVNGLINLVAMKSGLDDNHNATWGLWDPSVSYSEFATYEYIMDEDEREARDREFEHFKQSAYYSRNNHTTYDVDMKEKSVDFIIAKAEEKRRQQSGEPAPARQNDRSSFWSAYAKDNDSNQYR